MNLILFDDDSRFSLMPLTLSRPVCEVRAGMLTLREKWERHSGLRTSWLTAEYLQDLYPLKTSVENIIINGSIVPYVGLMKQVLRLKSGQSLMAGSTLVAARATAKEVKSLRAGKEIAFTETLECTQAVMKVERPWELFLHCGQWLADDFALITKGRKSLPLNKSNTLIGKGKIFIEKGARINGAFINVDGGPVYIGADAEVMEGSMIRGPFALGAGSVLKMGAKIYGPTSIGPQCKMGGEINNSVVFGYSNKAHDGFLGNAVIGEWCNLGADTNNSNLKNNYGQVQIYDYATDGMIDTGLVFCGVVMGDHSKTGINTMLNTGTVVGFSANIFGAGFPEKNVPSFTWGGMGKLVDYEVDKALETAARMMERRGLKADRKIAALFNHIHTMAKQKRGAK